MAPFNWSGKYTEDVHIDHDKRSDYEKRDRCGGDKKAMPNDFHHDNDSFALIYALIFRSDRQSQFQNG